MAIRRRSLRPQTIRAELDVSENSGGCEPPQSPYRKRRYASGQFVFTQTRGDPRVHSVDFTISLSRYRNRTLEPRDDRSLLRVPALPRESVERLNRLQDSDLERLAVVEQYAVRDGLLVATRPGTPVGDLDAVLRWSRGQLQVGLTRKETEYVRDRLEKLRLALDTRQIATF